MKELKITVDQLKNYLGTGLMVQVGSTKRNLTALQDDCRLAFVTAWMGSREKQMVGIENVKPICYRLSDLDKEIEHNGESFVPLEKLRETFSFATTGYVNFDKDLDLQVEPFMDGGDVGDVFINMLDFMEIMKLLYKWHFWAFGNEYFEQGLVIDKIKITKK